MNYPLKENVRILYLGTPKIAVKPLLKLIELGYNVVGVVTQEDKEVGRKRILTPSPVKVAALEHDIPVYQPHRIRLDHSWANDLDLDVIITMAYGQILPDDLLSLPKRGSINLHGSLLPEYRGAAPIQRAIEDGKKETGITLMEMTHEMDAGRMYAKEKIKIEESDTYSSMCDKLSDLGAFILEKYLFDYLNDEIKGETQDISKVTFANKISPEEEKLSLDLNAKDLMHKIHSLSEEPGAYLLFSGKKFKIYNVSLFDEEETEPVGTLSFKNKKLLLQAKNGHLSLINVQLEGKKKMSGMDFASGAHLNNKEILS